MLDSDKLQAATSTSSLQQAACQGAASGSRSASSLQTIVQASSRSSSKPSLSTKIECGSPTLIDSALLSRLPSLPFTAAPMEQKPVTKMQQHQAGSDEDHLLKAFNSQLQGPTELSQRACNGTSGSGNCTETHAAPASAGVAAISGPFAGQTAFPAAALPWPSLGLVRNVSDLLRSSSWGSCGAGQMDESMQALARGAAHGNDVPNPLDPLATGMLRSSAAAAAHSAGVSAPDVAPCSSFPMQPASQPHVTLEAAPVADASVPGPNAHGNSPNFSGLYPTSPQASWRDWGPQQDPLNDWSMDIPAAAACHASAALVNNAMLESLGMPDLPGFLGNAVQPVAGDNVAAWDCSTTRGPGATYGGHSSDRLALPPKHHPSGRIPGLTPPTGPAAITIKPDPSICHADGSARCSVLPAVTSKPSSSKPYIRPACNTFSIRPSPAPLLPITTGGCRIPIAGPNPAQQLHTDAAAAAAKDVFNISSMDSMLAHHQQNGPGHPWGMPTGQAPAQHPGADWVALGSVAPAAMAATPKLEGLRMTASDIGDFLGPGGEACPQESSGLRRSARAPKPLKPIGEELSHEDHSSLSEPEEAETPPSKRSKGPSGSSNSGGQQPRRRAGRPILPVENPGGGALTQEQLRLVRRRMHNRESARRSRSKRQATYEEQSDKVRSALGQKAVLEQQVAVLKNHCRQFQSKLVQLQGNYTTALNECASLQQQLDHVKAGQAGRLG